MRFVKFAILLSLSVQSTRLLADVENKEALLPKMTLNFVHIQASRLKNHSYKDRLSFANKSAMSSFTYEFTKNSGLQYGIGIDNTRFNFHKHPHVLQKGFTNLLVNLGSYWQCSKKLLLNASVLAHINADHINLRRYTFYEVLIQSVYSVNKKIQTILGIYTACGLGNHLNYRVDYNSFYHTIFPVVGINYSPTKKLSLSAAFPINVVASYAFTDAISLNATLKQYGTAQKLGINEPKRFRKGVIGYCNTGLESGLTFKAFQKISTNFFIGRAFGAHVNICDQKFKQKGAFYLGLTASMNF